MKTARGYLRSLYTLPFNKVIVHQVLLCMIQCAIFILYYDARVAAKIQRWKNEKKSKDSNLWQNLNPLVLGKLVTFGKTLEMLVVKYLSINCSLFAQMKSKLYRYDSHSCNIRHGVNKQNRWLSIVKRVERKCKCRVWKLYHI